MIVETTGGAEKPPSARSDSLPAQEIVGGPAVDVFSARSTSFPFCTKEESLVVRRAGTTTLCPPLIIKLASAAWTSPRLTRRITSVATVVTMCVLLGLRCSKATLERPEGPQEETVLTSLKGKASP